MRSSPKAELAARFRDLLVPKLDAIAHAAQIADRDASMSLAWPADDVTFDLRDGVGDAVIVLREDVDEERVPQLRFSRLGFDPVRIARQMLDLTIDPVDYVDPKRARAFEPQLQQVARATHVMVVYTHRMREPAPDGAREFIGGFVEGAALLMQIDGAVLRGGFVYAASSSFQLRSDAEVLDRSLRDDLARQFARALLAETHVRFPRAELPSTFGY